MKYDIKAAWMKIKSPKADQLNVGIKAMDS
jgi:hypothetical protein